MKRKLNKLMKHMKFYLIKIYESSMIKQEWVKVKIKIIINNKVKIIPQINNRELMVKVLKMNFLIIFIRRPKITTIQITKEEERWEKHILNFGNFIQIKLQKKKI